ncbi:integrase [Paenibacillus antri]|uniref:Integrase n=1 Tax=Paenibacillus antri TaxID=2582848 RepID=A0A5R9FXS4_9BACL|nr:tyrosine-type recombinase/integrase [Paenibacillus antri]TLS48852.1 integrase [Paenibacillus antri]
MISNPNQLNEDNHPTVSFKNAVNFFLQDCKVRNLTKETLRRYRNGLKKFHHVLEVSNKDMTTLTALDLTHRIIPGMFDEGLALRTVNCNICILKEFFKFLATEGWMETNIVADLKPFKVLQSSTHTFTEGHLQRLFSQPDRSTFTGYRNYIMMLVLFDTGIRLKELTNLRVTDIDFEEQTIRILQGKGRKHRIVPIQRTCVLQLNHYLQERGKLEHDRLWVNLDNQPFEDSGIRVMISRYCKAAEIQGVQCSCHTFRHTFAKQYLLNGGDMFTLKNILGHERMETTEYYVELFSRDMQIQHEKFSPVEHLADEFPSSIDESGVSQQ